MAVHLIRGHRLAWAIVIGLHVVMASPAHGGRPLATEDTGVLDPGVVELELGVDYVRERSADLFLIPGGPVLNIGLLPRLEGTLATELRLVDPDDGPPRAGFGDSQVRLKYRFLDETAGGPALVGAVTVRLPTGDEKRGLGDQGADVQPLVLASKTFGPVTLTVNAGYLFVIRDRDLDAVSVNASTEVEITRAWSIVGEVVSELAARRRADDRVVVRIGTVYAVGERVKLDAAAGFGATRASPDVLLTIGLTVTLN
jgi:Putative MetA-pathway of phenol degradation